MATTFGETPSGVDWCIKALHPADPLVEVRGIPDESAIPSVFLNYQAVSTIKPNTAATGTWETDLQLLPHPITFLAGYVTDSTGTSNVQIGNAQLPGGASYNQVNAFLAMATRWRLAYAAVTVYQDGPALSDQGTVCVCQKPLALMKQNYAGGSENLSLDPVSWMPPAAVGSFHLVKYRTDDYPDYSSSQAMPNAYFGQSKEGVYVPLKLTRTHQKWHSTANLVQFAQAATEHTAGPFQRQFQIPNATEGLDTTGFFPFFDSPDAAVFLDEEDVFAFARLGGGVVPDFCNDVVADIGFRNLSVNSSLSLYFRYGFELQVSPQSTLAPELRLSPPYDPLAVSTYFKVSRELKDAYPADYNDLGKMWDMISAGLKAVNKTNVLQAIPGFGPALQLASHGIVTGGDALRNLSQQRGPRGRQVISGRGSTVSASQKERLVKRRMGRGGRKSKKRSQGWDAPGFPSRRDKQD